MEFSVSEKLIKKVAEATGLTQKAAKEAAFETLKGIVEIAKEDGRATLIGFGSFEVKATKERNGRNPRNPEEVIKIPAGKKLTFKASKQLKDSI